LHRLNLKSDISDKELDLFLNNNARLKDNAKRNTIEQKDFVEIFSTAII